MVLYRGIIKVSISGNTVANLSLNTKRSSFGIGSFDNCLSILKQELGIFHVLPSCHDLYNDVAGPLLIRSCLKVPVIQSTENLIYKFHTAVQLRLLMFLKVYQLLQSCFIVSPLLYTRPPLRHGQASCRTQV